MSAQRTCCQRLVKIHPSNRIGIDPLQAVWVVRKTLVLRPKELDREYDGCLPACSLCHLQPLHVGNVEAPVELLDHLLKRDSSDIHQSQLPNECGETVSRRARWIEGEALKAVSQHDP